MGATVAAAIVIKEKHIVEAFRAAGATTPDAAATPASLGVSERLAFGILVRDAVLRQTTPGYYYLDEPSWNAKRSMRRRTGLVIAAAVALVIIALAAVGIFCGQR